MKLVSCLVFVLFSVCGSAHAEGGSCPDGYYPVGGQGTSGCAPIPNYDTGPQDGAEVRPTGEWKTTWLAIAIDPIVGDVGVSSGMLTEVDARYEALTRCRKHGATQCRATAFHNQCAVIAWPQTSGAKTVTAGAATIELASKVALSECASNGGGNCNIVSAECSRPVFKKF